MYLGEMISALRLGEIDMAGQWFKHSSWSNGGTRRRIGLRTSHFNIILCPVVFFCLALSGRSAIAQKQSDENPQKGVQGAFHWVEKPRIEFKPSAEQLLVITEATRANEQRFTLALTREQAELFERLFSVKVTETTVQRMKLPQSDVRISIGNDYVFEYPQMYLTECGVGKQPNCITYQYAIQKETIRGESRPSMEFIEALKVEPVFTMEQRKTIATAFRKGKDEITINLTAKQNALFNRVFGTADRKKITVTLMPVKPIEVRVKKNDELAAKGCGIRDWETTCRGDSCSMLCKPACD